MTYLILLCASVLLMCHWLACALAYLARYELWRAKASDQFAFWSLGNSKHDRAWRWYADESLGCREYGREKRKHAANVWVCEAYPPNPALRIADASMYDRWLVAFYWAVYTCSTVGFGGVSLNSNAEKLLACLVMVLGAVVCDAGIAAVLTAVVEHKDHQHGTNRRRRECGRRMMAAARVPMAARARVAAYFDYVDDDLHNLDDATVLEELNVALRFAHYGYILESGRVVMDGPAASLRENPDVKEFYLGMSEEGRKSFRDVRSYRRRKRWLS